MAEKGTVAVRFIGDMKELFSSLVEGDGKLSKFAEGAVKGFGGVAVAAAGVGTALFEVGEKFEKSYNQIRVQTGATGEAMKGLEESFKKVTATVPNDFGAISAAIGTVNQKLGLTGKPLEEMATQVLNLSRITKTDLSANVSSITSLFNNWGIATADQSDKLDILFNASQASGVSVDSLASTMASGGAKLREAGLSFNQTASLIALLGKNGVDAAAVMMPLGKAIGAAAKAHVDAGAFITKTFNDIKTSSEQLGNSEALKVFGAKGIQMAGLIREGKLSYQDFMQTVMNSQDTINKAADATMTFHDKLNLLKNQALVALEPIAMKVVEQVTSLLDRFSKLSPQTQHIIEVVLLLVGGLVPLVAVLGSVFTAIGILFSPITLIVLAIAALAAGVIYAYTHWQWFRDAVDAVASFMRDTVWPILQTIAGYLDEHFVPALGHVKDAFFEVKDSAETSWNAIIDIVDGAWKIIEPILSKISEGIGKVTGALSHLPGGVVGGALSTIVPGAGSLFGGVRAAGGSVIAGRGYIVGEKGPEWFQPGSSGSITANGGFGGGMTHVSETIVLQFGSEQVIALVREYERTNGKSWRDA